MYSQLYCKLNTWDCKQVTCKLLWLDCFLRARPCKCMSSFHCRNFSNCGKSHRKCCLSDKSSTSHRKRDKVHSSHRRSTCPCICILRSSCSSDTWPNRSWYRLLNQLQSIICRSNDKKSRPWLQNQSTFGCKRTDWLLSPVFWINLNRKKCSLFRYCCKSNTWNHK